MVKTKILLICNKGNVRSRYLARYLKEKGYATKWGGVSRSAIVKLTQNKINWADKLVVVDNLVMKKLKERYKLPKKEIIRLNVSDSPKRYPKSGFVEKYRVMRDSFIRGYVHPNLRKQINKKLKFNS